MFEEFSRCDVLGVSTAVATIESAAERLVSAAQAGADAVACFSATHLLVECQDRPDVMEAVRAADVVFPDGKPVAVMQKLQGHKNAERCAGPDTTLAACRVAAERGVRVGFYGSTQATLDALCAKLEAKFPALRIAFREASIFRPMTDDEDAALVSRINNAAPQILFVGLGCPRQELWSIAHRARVRGVLCPVGAAFDFHAGTIKRAPLWMQRWGVEWVHRFAQEPRRLAKRYLVQNSRFLWLAMGQLVGWKRWS